MLLAVVGTVCAEADGLTIAEAAKDNAARHRSVFPEIIFIIDQRILWPHTSNYL